MLKNRINYRQAEEPAAPKQEFASPQDEILHIKQTDRTLSGFARILEIIRDADFFNVWQSRGALQTNWLTEHRTQCGACVGALLAWFFDTALDSDGNYCFIKGSLRLQIYLGLGTGDIGGCLVAAGAPEDPFNSVSWDTDYADVFHELARRFPGK